MLTVLTFSTTDGDKQMKYPDINRVFFWIVGAIVAFAIVATTATIVT